MTPMSREILRQLDLVQDPGKRSTLASQMVGQGEALVAELRHKRNCGIAEQHETGSSPLVIGRRLGMSKTQVQTVLRDIRAMQTESLRNASTR